MQTLLRSLDVVDNNKIFRRYRRRELLPTTPKILWYIHTGSVRMLTLNEDGSVIPLGLASVGDIVGHELSQIQPYQIECLTDVCLQPIDIDRCPGLDKIMLNRLRHMEELLRIRSGKIGDRLTNLLDWLGDCFSENTGGGKEINIRLTHQDIADMLGTTRVTVTRLLGQFERDRKIVSNGQQSITILSNKSDRASINDDRQSRKVS
jgi:CRP-like cAMP-binding protein